MFKRIKNWFSLHKSMLKGWVVSYIVVLMVPLLICFVSYFQMYGTVKEEIENTNILMFKHFATNIDYKLKELSNIEIDLMDDAALNNLCNYKQPLSIDQKYEILRYAKEEMKFTKLLGDFISGYCIYIPEAHIVIRTGGFGNANTAYTEFQIENMDEKEWMELIDQKHFRKFVPVQTVNGSGILYLHSLPAMKDSFCMNFIALIKSEYFKEALSSLTLQNGGNFFILDSSNTVVYKDKTQDEILDLKYEIIDTEKVESIKLPGGKNMVMTAVDSAIADLKFISFIPKKGFWEKAFDLMRLFITSVILCLMIGILIIYVFTKRNYRPVNRLLAILSNNRELKNDKDEYQFILSAVTNMLEEKRIICDKLNKKNADIQKIVLSKILQGGWSFKDTEEILDMYHINIPDGNYAVILFSLDNYENYFENTDDKSYMKENINMVNYAIVSILNEMLFKQYSCNTTEAGGLLTCVLSFPIDMDKSECQTEVMNIIELCKNILQNEIYITLTISISGIHSLKSELHSAFMEATNALEKRIVRGENCIINYMPLEEYQNERYVYSIEVEVSLLNNIKHGNYDESIHILDTIIKENILNNRLSVSAVKYIIYDLAGTILKAVNDLEIDLKKDISVMIESISSYTVFEAQTAMKDIIGKICETINLSKKSHNTQLKDDIIEYIMEHYAEKDLGNVAIAEHFSIQHAYLSRFFKEQTGENISRYIQKVRIAKAKELLKDNSLTLDEICQIVGYYNSATLIRNFKKYEGITPSVYRKD